MANRFYTLLCTVLPALALPAAAAQPIDYTRSQITFVSRQMNVPVEAKFNRFTAEVSFDPANPQAGKARVEIDMTSFDIGNEEINVEVRNKDWFDTRSFPKATFESTAVRVLGNGRYEVRGPLTIKGRTHEIAAPFTVKTDAGGTTAFDGTFSIRRLQYGIGEGIWKDTDLVADEVRVRFRLYTGGKPPARK